MIAGDGIGPEITAATREVLNAANSSFKLNLLIEDGIAGHASLQKKSRLCLLRQIKNV